MAEKPAKEINLNDPDFRQLVRDLSTLVEAENENGYYSVKDLAELFDANKQTVYKWIAEDKIEYKKTAGLEKQKKCKIYPDTEFGPNCVSLPKNGKNPVSHHEIKCSFTEKSNE